MDVVGEKDSFPSQVRSGKWLNTTRHGLRRLAWFGWVIDARIHATTKDVAEILPATTGRLPLPRAESSYSQPASHR
jgi:hypothetical protein